MTRNLYILLAVLLAAATATAQFGRGGGRSRGFSGEYDIAAVRNDLPVWENPPRFKGDVFTFVRIRYTSGSRPNDEFGEVGRRRGGGFGGGGGGRRGGGGGFGGGRWAIDWPDSDLNFPLRLQQMTSLEVEPDSKIFDLPDERLLDYPFCYVIEPGAMALEEEEVKGLRDLLNGGFLMVDDFWGEYARRRFDNEMKLVFPDREPKELSLDHEIFHCVFDLKKKPQIPSIGWWTRNGTTNERGSGEASYRGLFDDKGRMMAIICHNTDLGDGWEREAEDATYFREFAEKWSYPLGINIVTYAMTH